MKIENGEAGHDQRLDGHSRSAEDRRAAEDIAIFGDDSLEMTVSRAIVVGGRSRMQVRVRLARS